MGDSYPKSVGIKELKDRASEIIASVQQTGRPVTITKSSQDVAWIVPIPSDPHERLVAAGLIKPGQRPRPLHELKLEKPGIDASRAVRGIIEDRDEG